MSKKVIALITLAFTVFLFIPLVSALALDTITLWTNKSEYTPGEIGTLHIVFYNDKRVTLTIENITIIFESWRTYETGQWKGNYTIEVKKAFVPDEILEKEVSFTVPTDGRAVNTDARVEVYANGYAFVEKYEISVSQTPLYMEQIITLFTIQVVLIIVCTIIIAATIFLSTRKPQVAKKETENTE